MRALEVSVIAKYSGFPAAVGVTKDLQQVRPRRPVSAQ